MSSVKCPQMCTTITFSILLFLSFSSHLKAQLEVGFYRESCPMAEFVVKGAVSQGYFRDRGNAAGLLRMHFHDCFVRGCDASVLLDSTPGNTAEKDAPANNPSLRSFEVIDDAKARLEEMCPGVVSCADITAYAARDAIEMSGGFGYDVPAGRRDGTVSLASDTRLNLPPFFADVDLLTKVFNSKGLTKEEMVILSGAHTIGRSYCSSFNNRLYNFNTASDMDPSLQPMYAARLRQWCPKGNTGSNTVVALDPASPYDFDTSYYRNILNNRGLFSSDQNLLSDSETAAQVRQYAMDTYGWQKDFADAMVKMGEIEVLTGDEGEIRRNCRVVNE